MIAVSKGFCGIALCLGLFPALLSLFFHGIAQVGGAAGLPEVVTFAELRFNFMKLEGLSQVNGPGSNNFLSLALVILSGGLAFVFRNTVAFIFFSFHFVLAVLCALLDGLFFVPLADKYLLVERAAMFSFAIVLFSQLAFLAFQSTSIRGTLRLVLSIFVSSAAFVVGCFALGFVLQRSDGTLLIFVTYIVMSYGIFGLHVASLTLLMDPGE